MRSLLVIAAVCVAVSAIPYTFNRDIKVPVYDVFKSLYAAAPLSSYLDHFAKEGFFKFYEDFFHFYPEEEIRDFIVVYKPQGESFLHGYYIKTEDVSKYGDEFFSTVRPMYDYLNSGEYYAFTPLAAKKIAPEYFNTPLKDIFYKHYDNIDLKREIPLVFLVPKSEVRPEALKEFLMVAEYEVTKTGTHDVHEYFENISKTITRRDLAYVTPPYYRSIGYPYTYGYNSYYYNSYLKSYPYYAYNRYLW